MESIKDLKVNLESKILNSEKVIIVPHNGIDFDAIGSAIGLSLIVKKLQKISHIVIDDPIYKMDHGAKLVLDQAKNNYSIINKEKYLQLANSNDLYILTDVNKSYLVSLSKEMNNEENIIIIDHHDEDCKTVKSNYKLIDSGISSASEIISKLLTIYKIKIPSDVANYLLAGIHLDTNRLSKNASSETFKVISKLMESGANSDIINRWFVEDFNSDRRVHNLISQAEMISFNYAVVKAEEYVEYTKEELAKVADYLLKYGVDGSFSIGNIGDGNISISARSNGNINVGFIMGELEGGGNKCSAATKIENSTVEEVGNKLIKTILPSWYLK